jgi:serine/threonine protein kinase
MRNQDHAFTDLVTSLLQVEPERRMDAHRALQHDFFAQNHEQNESKQELNEEQNHDERLAKKTRIGTH